MPEAPVHNRLDWPHHFGWVRRLGGEVHAQAHAAAHSDFSVDYKQDREYDATKGAHSHYTPPLVCSWCGAHAPQEFEQWRSQYCRWCGKLNDWPLDQQPDAQQTDRV